MKNVLLVLALVVVSWGRAAAQTAPPTLQKLSPNGAARGTNATVTIEGTNIGAATRLVFSEPGLSARITGVEEIPVEKMVVPKGVVRTDAPIDDKARRYELTAVVTVGPQVPHGVHGFRLLTPLGVSNQLRFAVSAFPETKDQEPNDAAAPQPATLPAALVGSLAKAGDVDAYRFRAQAGVEMVFEVVARPLGSRLDSVIKLLDAAGNVIAENNDRDLNRDSLLTWRFASTGAYTLVIEDVEHGGGADGFGYRVHAGALPYVTSVFPLGVRDGEVGDITLTGVNLAAGPMRVTGKARYPGGRTISLAAIAPGGPALNLKTLALGGYQETVETEPNDDLARAQPLTIPSTVNGRVSPTRSNASSARAPGHGDEDVFRFSATKGQKVIFDVTAQQLGSALDSIVEVLDAEGRPVRRALIRCLARTELALNDPDSNRRSMRVLTWNELAINDYLLIGDELLQVETLPTNPDDDLDFRSFRGVRSTLLDTSPRNHAVGDAVYKVSLHPPDARLEPNGMPIVPLDFVNDDGGSRFGGKDSRLHFEAPADGTYYLRLRDVRGLEGERFAYRLTARAPTPDYTVAFDPRSFNLPRGGRVSVTVTADRKDGFDGPIDVELVGLPAGLTATAGRIPPGADTTVLMIAAAADASLDTHKAKLRTTMPRSTPYEVAGLAALRLVARASIGGTLVEREAAPIDPLDVVALAPRPDLIVTTTASRVELTAGREVTLTVAVERHNGFTGRVPITVMNLPHGVRVNDVGLNGVMITEAETSRTVHLIAEPWVEPVRQTIVVVGRVEVNSPLRNEAAALPVELVVTSVTAGR